MGKAILLILAVAGLLLIGGIAQPAQAGHYYSGYCGSGYYSTGYTPYYTGYSGYYSPGYSTWRPVYNTGYTGYSTWYAPTYSAWYPRHHGYWYGGYDDDDFEYDD